MEISEIALRIAVGAGVVGIISALILFTAILYTTFGITAFLVIIAIVVLLFVIGSICIR